MNIFMVENKKIFVDSNYFVALFNPKDSQHKKAREIAQLVEEEKLSLIISNFAFLEIVTVVSQRRNRVVAVDLGEYLIHDPMIDIIHIDEDLQKESWEIFKEAKNKNISFVDCSIIASMRTGKISNLLTFDVKDFQMLLKKYHLQLYFPEKA